mgnify:CR=1 FL=1
MDTETLMRVLPDELGSLLLQRRVMLKDTLPGVIRNLEAEEDQIKPKVERLNASFNVANSNVVKEKKIRDQNQKEARILIPQVKSIREKLIDSGGMIILDPKWKKEKLIERIEEIEHKIQTSALDQKSEKKLLDQRRALVLENDKWLRNRKDSNPEMIEYLEKSRKMSSLFKKADKAHSKMINAVKKAQPLYEKMSIADKELKDIRSQLDRARELLSQSDKAIRYWKRRLDEGFGNLGPGFNDLLRQKQKVEGGGNSSFAKTTVKRPKKVLEEE